MKLIIIILCGIPFLYSCENITESIPKKDPEPGRRDYVWQWDTLDMQMNTIESVWGVNPNDVWAVGPGGTEQDRLLHYDGKNWSAYNKELIHCTGNTLFGFSRDNIWMGGGAGWEDTGAAIWHYNGNSWKRNYIHKIEGAHIVDIDDIWGQSKNDIYACGLIVYKDTRKEDFRGLLLHWNGSNWKELYRADFESQFQRVREFENKVFIISYDRRNGLRSNFQYKNHNLEVFYSGYEKDINTAQFDIIDNQLYFSIGNIFYKYNNGSLDEFLHFESGFQQYFVGYSLKDIFFLTSDGILHYNGEDTRYILKYPMPVIGICNGIKIKNQYFQGYIATYSNTNMMLHGKLKE